MSSRSASGSQRLEQQAAPARLERHDIFLAAHRQLADPDLLRGLQRVAKDDIGLLGKVVGGHDKIWLLVIHGVDVVDVDELDEVEGLAALELDALDLLGVEQDVMALGDFVALDDLVAVDGTDARHDLFIFDALAGRLVDLVELDLGAALGRLEKLHRDRHERQPDLSSPDRARGHDLVSFESRRLNSLRRRLVPCRRLQRSDKFAHVAAAMG